MERVFIGQLQVKIPWNFQLKTLSKKKKKPFLNMIFIQVSHPLPLCWGPWAAVDGQLPSMISYIHPQDRGIDCSQGIRPGPGGSQVDPPEVGVLRTCSVWILEMGNSSVLRGALSSFWQFLFPQSKISDITLQSSIPRLLSTYPEN